MAEVNIEPLISFGPITKDNLEWVRQVHNDPHVLKMLTDSRTVSREEQKEWFKNLQKSKSSLRMIVYVGGTGIGVVRLDQIDRQNRSVCMGMDLDYRYRGKGFAAPIYKKLLYEWFHKEGMNRIWLLVAEYNEVARKLYTNLGFKEEGKQRQALMRQGKYHDYIMMSILKEEYEARNK